VKAGRIRFVGNPWPEGHPIKAFHWGARLVDGDVWFDLHLESDDYYAEREIDDDPSVEYLSDWVAPSVWYNFHSCTISSTKWHYGGFRVCPIGDLSIDALRDLRFHVDPLPCDLTDHDARAFHVYLLGHDTVVDHRIEFSRGIDPDCCDIRWKGKIALTYVGQYEARHSFEAEIHGVPIPGLLLGA
jgi:hypothetical protein